MKSKFELHQIPGGVAVKSWTRGVFFEEGARNQLANIARLPIVGPHVAAMPDVHIGIGATVGSVIPTTKAIIPAAVGVDIGCGMMAVRTSMQANDLPGQLSKVRASIERTVPVGFNDWQRRSRRKSLGIGPPAAVETAWKPLEKGFARIAQINKHLGESKTVQQLGTLGGGNHFIEVCLDESDRVWVMLHSGSRGVGNRIGQYFIRLAQKDMRSHIANLPDKNLAYFEEGSPHFDDYVAAVGWAQAFARQNREVMMQRILHSLRTDLGLVFTCDKQAVNCHHNYVQKEMHFGQEVWLTRKGAVSAAVGDMGIIPGSMGARSYIVRGKGNVDSFNSCSHGAGRTMSRTKAKKVISLEQHEQAMRGVEARLDRGVLDESPAAYKDIDTVMQAQSDLVDIVHTLKQIVNVKG